MPRRALALALALTLGCGPSLARLERGHHYDEAVCGVVEGAFPEDQVRPLLRRALDPALHVAVVPRDRLAAVLGDAAPELDRYALLQISHDSNTVPLSRYSARIVLVRGDRTTSPEPVDLGRLAAVFREQLPGPRTVGPGAIESAAHTAGVVGAAILTVVSLGLLGGLLRGAGPAPSSRTEYPTEAELRRAAPRAARLYDTVAHLQARCSGRPGERCRTLVLVPRPPEEPAQLALAVDLSYGSRCTLGDLGETLTIPLPPGPTLEARLAALFGQDMRRLADLPVRAAPPDFTICLGTSSSGGYGSRCDVEPPPEPESTERSADPGRSTP